MTPGTFIEMRWRCSACSAENLGRFGDCQTCRKRRDSEPYYDAPGSRPLSAEEVSADPALSAEAFGGPDWRCTRCGTSQERASRTCSQCGSEQVAAAALTGGAPIAPPAELEMPSSFGRALSRPASFAPPPRMHPLVRELLWGGVLVLAIAAAGMSAWLLLR